MRRRNGSTVDAKPKSEDLGGKWVATKAGTVVATARTPNQLVRIIERWGASAAGIEARYVPEAHGEARHMPEDVAAFGR